jgi:ATP dependent DNA ligase C terminal region
MKECRWVKPDLICQVAFLEWTDSGHLRHCKFLGMCDDKNAKDVVRETYQSGLIAGCGRWSYVEGIAPVARFRSRRAT